MQSERTDGYAYPNPFDQSVTFPVSVDQENSMVVITIINMQGQQVRSLEGRFKLPGRYEMTWDGASSDPSLPVTGVLLYKISVNGNPGPVRRMVKLGK